MVARNPNETKAPLEPDAMVERPVPAWLPYLVPMATYLVLATIVSRIVKQSHFAGPYTYPIAYFALILLATGAVWSCRDTWRDLKPRPSRASMLLAAALGVLVTLLWVGLDGHYPAIPMLGSRVGYDPSEVPLPGRILFLVVRFYGLVVLVPLLEELFWRSFVIRWIAHPTFQEIPIGRVTLLGAVISSALFALGHPEWLPALITGFLWAWLLRHTRSVAACVISHAVANLALGIYVLITGAWRFW